MPDAMEAAYDAANKENRQLKKQVEYYRRIAETWQEIAGRLFSLIEEMGDADVDENRG
jgi:hypothetical protein